MIVVKKKPTETWVCPEGCDLSASPCKHLERLISNPNKEPQFENKYKCIGSNVEKAYYESGAGFVIPEGIRSRSYEYQFRAKMEKAGLEPVKVDILVLRFVYSMSLRDIAEELGVMSSMTVLRLYEEAMTVLKRRVKK